MQELLTIISFMRRDLETLTKSVAQMRKTHAQVLSEEWITSDQVMKILKICPRTLNSLKSSGKLSYSKVQGTIYFRTVDIENLLKQNYISPLSANAYSIAKAESNDR